LGHLLNAHAFSSALLASFALSEVLDDAVNELAEIFTDWQINKNFLEEHNEVLARKAAYGLEALELSEWVHRGLDDGWAQAGPHP